MRVSLIQVLKKAGFRPEEVWAFWDWPTLKLVARRYVHFVSPWLVVDGQNFAECKLREAILAYDTERAGGGNVCWCEFTERLAESFRTLAALRESVKRIGTVYGGSGSTMSH